MDWQDTEQRGIRSQPLVTHYYLKKREDTAEESTKQHGVELCGGSHHAAETVNLVTTSLQASLELKKKVPWSPNMRTNHWNHFLCSGQSEQEREAESG